MASEIKTDQRIARLTPLAEVLADIDSHVKPVAPSRRDISSAVGLTLSEDIHVAQSLPAQAIALRDGYAVEAEATRDASSYAPVLIPSPSFVNAGDALPPGTDSIIPQDIVTIQGATAAILSPATIGDAVLPVGADAEPMAPLFCPGHVIRHSDIAILRAASVSDVDVRAPRICVLQSRQGDDTILDAATTWMRHAVATAGGHPVPCVEGDLAETLRAVDADAVIGIGGTGTGRHDNAVASLAERGELKFHGIAISPGETAAFGFVGGRPVLLSPGRLDATIACWLFVGERILARLCGRPPDDAGRIARLTRKVSSSLGITELIAVACKEGQAEPLGSTYLSLQVMARANGWISVPAQSEGYPAGASVAVRPLP